MSTALAGAVAGVAALFDAVTSSEVEVRTGWRYTVALPTVLTVGTTDPAFDLGDLSTPMARLDRAIMGGTHSHDSEQLRVFCSLQVPPPSDDSTPTSAIDLVDTILGQCADALKTSRVYPGVQRAWLTEVTVFLSDASSGFGAAATFAVVLESYV